MEGTKFSNAYRFPATGRYHPDQQKVALFKSAHKWSDTFSEVTHDVLEGKQPNPETSANLLRSYMTWAGGELVDIIETTCDIDDEYDEKNAKKLHYHLLNIAAIGLWKHILVDERQSIPAQLVRVVQTNLATQAIDLMRQRQEHIDQGDFYSNEMTEKRLSFLGLLNEFDTAITTQEISLSRPTIVVVPGASQFESSSSRERNSDFLAIDLRMDSDNGERQARGIQAKLTVDHETAEETDDDFITLIDGVIDLGSTKAVRPNAHKSHTVTRAWPGLVAAHHLLNTKSVGIVPNAAKANMRISGDKRATVQAMQVTTSALQQKYEARRYAEGTKSNNKNAARIVVKRVLDDMYK